MINIKKIVSAEMDQNCYLIEKDKRGILIDPGYDTFKIIKQSEGIKINYILLTHCHFDHIYSVGELRSSKMVIGSKLCSRNITNNKITLLPANSKNEAPCDVRMQDNEIKELDGIKVKCIYTPGHTDGSVCYLIENNLFSGDTLFYTSIGRCDFATGNIKEIEKSIREKLYTLPDETKVFPGHGPSTSIGFEKKNNGYFTE